MMKVLSTIARMVIVRLKIFDISLLVSMGMAIALAKNPRYRIKGKSLRA